MAHNDYENDYETLSEMIGKLTLRKKQLAMEMFKTVNNLKPEYMKSTDNHAKCNSAVI